MTGSTCGRLARLAALAAALTLAAAVVSMRPPGAASEEAATKPGPPALGEDAFAVAPGDPEPSPVPVAGPPPSGVSCASGWTWFQNPALHYGLCVPPGWGFTDFTGPAPLMAIPARHLTALHLVSSRAFPWEPGDLPFDAVRSRGMIDVELTLLEAGLAAVDECEPIVTISPRASCEQRYDLLGLPDADGSLIATKIAVPLLRPPTLSVGVQPGARLLVVARTSSATPAEEVDLLWQLIDGIRSL